MFQYVWYDKSKFSGQVARDLPEEYINITDIAKMGSVYWAEHCTECAVPECYNNCALWESRIDKKCRRFVYGIRKEKAKKSFNATLELKKWGKIDSPFFNRVLSPKQMKWLDQINYFSSNVVKFISKGLRFASPTMKASGFWEYSKNKAYKHYGRKGCLPSFLVSCFLHGDQQQSLSFEIYNKNTILVRKSIDLTPGYNQLLLDLGNYSNQITQNTRTRIFGSENTACEITFFFLDFVELNKSGKIKLLPKGEKSADKVKCVVWDLDNTIWDGILIEADAQKLELRPGVLETIRWLDERGIIQCVCSKNDYAMAEGVLKRLGIDEYFIYKSINWFPKSLNIHELATKININVDTFAFVDDSESERNEVKNHLPSVRVFKETDISDFFELPEFTVPVTEDSKNRRKMYQINRTRAEYESKLNLNHQDFLRECTLCADITHIHTEEQKKRSYELLLRTNQLNLSGKRYTEEEFDDFLTKNKENIYILSLKDKFGTYGQSLFLYVQPDENSIMVNEFTLSCRIAGKYVESAIMYWLTQKHGKKDIVLVGKNNKKNTLLINTLKEIGFEQASKFDSDELLLIHKGDTIFEGCDIVSVTDHT